VNSAHPGFHCFNPLNAESNPIYHLLALLGAHHIVHVSRIRVKCPSMVYGRAEQHVAVHESIGSLPSPKYFPVLQFNRCNVMGSTDYDNGNLNKQPVPVTARSKA